MKCESCTHWVLRRLNLYSDNTTIDTYTAPPGKGFCDVLNMETAPDFGCNKYEEGADHDKATLKQGAPWQNWHFGPCPNCDGRGCHMVELRPACRRCAGLGKVRHYDDGYIADASWDHPKEKELKKQQALQPDPGLTLSNIKKHDEGILEGGSI